jgi:hypothetical protein
LSGGGGDPYAADPSQNQDGYGNTGGYGSDPTVIYSLSFLFLSVCAPFPNCFNI